MYKEPHEELLQSPEVNTARSVKQRMGQWKNLEDDAPGSATAAKTEQGMKPVIGSGSTESAAPEPTGTEQGKTQSENAANANPTNAVADSQAKTIPAIETVTSAKVGIAAAAEVPREAVAPAPAREEPMVSARRQRMGNPQPAAGAQTTTSQTPEMKPAAPKQRMGSASKERWGVTAAATAPIAAVEVPFQEPGTSTTPPASGTQSPMEAPATAKPALTSSEGGSYRPVALGTPTMATAPSGSAPAAKASKPSAGRPRWVRQAIAIVGVVFVAAIVVLIARSLRTLEPVQDFIRNYPGHATMPATAPEGMPAWMGWQHFLNMFFLVLIVRTGMQIRAGSRPAGYWKPGKASFFSPKGNSPKKVSLHQWLHQSLDVLWVANGLIFVVLLAVTGHWMRIVPTSLDVFPNMLSTLLQYASLDWPTENGWVHYNALQMVAYFLIVYVAAPLAVASGLRMSTWWPTEAKIMNQIYPAKVARKVHFPVMLFFVAFTIVHVFLVFFTGALRNLNHMYTSKDAVDWWGLVIFMISVAVIAAGWFLTKPVFAMPLANRMGTVTKN